MDLTKQYPKGISILVTGDAGFLGRQIVEGFWCRVSYLSKKPVAAARDRLYHRQLVGILRLANPARQKILS